MAWSGVVEADAETKDTRAEEGVGGEGFEKAGGGAGGADVDTVV